MARGDKKMQRSFMRQVRKSFGLTQQDVANIIGISRNHLGNIETGKHDPSWEIAVKLATLYKMSAEKILKRDDE